jgi:hypothetical protein
MGYNRHMPEGRVENGSNLTQSEFSIGALRSTVTYKKQKEAA